jgi:hypothetical protein
LRKLSPAGATTHKRIFANINRHLRLNRSIEIFITVGPYKNYDSTTNSPD